MNDMAIPVMEFQKLEYKINFLPKNERNDDKLSGYGILFLLLFSTSNFEKILVKNVSWVDYSLVFIICSFHQSQA